MAPARRSRARGPCALRAGGGAGPSRRSTTFVVPIITPLRARKGSRDRRRVRADPIDDPHVARHVAELDRAAREHELVAVAIQRLAGLEACRARTGDHLCRRGELANASATPRLTRARRKWSCRTPSRIAPAPPA